MTQLAKRYYINNARRLKEPVYRVIIERETLTTSAIAYIERQDINPLTLNRYTNNAYDEIVTDKTVNALVQRLAQRFIGINAQYEILGAF